MGFLQNKPEEIKETIEEPEIERRKEVQEVKPKEIKERWIVVRELPTQVVRETTSDDGTILHFITIEEALTQELNK